jgi:hypothetical protein
MFSPFLLHGAIIHLAVEKTHLLIRSSAALYNAGIGPGFVTVKTNEAMAAVFLPLG